MSDTKKFKDWCSDRCGHPLGVSLGMKAVIELEQENAELREQRNTWSELFHSEKEENDRLLKENAELRDASNSLLDLFKNVVFTHNTHKDRSNFLKARDNLKQLLNK